MTIYNNLQTECNREREPARVSVSDKHGKYRTLNKPANLLPQTDQQI